jgi:RNA polymerase sigma-70 factor (ECF subfamily)
VHGLRSLLLHSNARSAARRGPGGVFVPLDQQDVGLWSRTGIDDAEHHLAVALELHRTGQPLGPYQLQAAIQSVHNRRAATGRTDWVTLAALYDGLVTLTPTVGAFVARAKAHSHVSGPQAALAVLDELPVELVGGYQPYWVVRAYCHLRAGDQDKAARAAETAMALTADDVVRSHLTEQYLGTDVGG